MDYDALISQVASKHGLDPAIFRAMIAQESSFNPRALGAPTKYGQARGLGQVLPSTAADYGVSDMDSLFDPSTNLDVAGQHLSRLLKKYGGDYDTGLTAYHTGEGNVDKGKIGPQGRQYPKLVRGRMAKGDAAQKMSSATPAQASVPFTHQAVGATRTEKNRASAERRSGGARAGGMAGVYVRPDGSVVFSNAPQPGWRRMGDDSAPPEAPAAPSPVRLGGVTTKPVTMPQQALPEEIADIPLQDSPYRISPDEAQALMSGWNQPMTEPPPFPGGSNLDSFLASAPPPMGTPVPAPFRSLRQQYTDAGAAPPAERAPMATPPVPRGGPPMRRNFSVPEDAGVDFNTPPMLPLAPGSEHMPGPRPGAAPWPGRDESLDYLPMPGSVGSDQAPGPAPSIPNDYGERIGPERSGVEVMPGAPRSYAGLLQEAQRRMLAERIPGLMEPAAPPTRGEQFMRGLQGAGSAFAAGAAAVGNPMGARTLGMLDTAEQKRQAYAEAMRKNRRDELSDVMGVMDADQQAQIRSKQLAPPEMAGLRVGEIDYGQVPMETARGAQAKEIEDRLGLPGEERAFQRQRTLADLVTERGAGLEKLRSAGDIAEKEAIAKRPPDYGNITNRAFMLKSYGSDRVKAMPIEQIVAMLEAGVPLDIGAPPPPPMPGGNGG